MVHLVDQYLQKVNPQLCVEPGLVEFFVVDVLSRAVETATFAVDDEGEAGRPERWSSVPTKLILFHKATFQSAPKCLPQKLVKIGGG